MFSNETIKWFAALDKTSIPVAGGKGANLGELAQMDLPVPPGFVVTTTAYDAFVAANDLQAPIVDLASQTQASDPTSFETASTQIRALFAGGVIPDDLVAAIKDAYAQLVTDGNIAVAVRSSATAEDLPSASFAGQQDTYLNVQGDDALLEAVKNCWASLWTARAIAYRQRQAIDPGVVSLAVVVQTLVAADAAGILFTANPLNGQRDQVVISATWGLGEAIVGGQVTPDTVIVDAANWQILSRETATKTTMTVRTQSGTEEQPIPLAQQDQPAIDDATALQLARYGAQIEAHYNAPMDIEWAVVDGAIAILQARPITTLLEPQLEPPTEWAIPKPGYTYYRASIVEQLPNPLSPLFATLGQKPIADSLTDMFVLILGGGEDSNDWLDFCTINGYGYYQLLASNRFYLQVLLRTLRQWDIYREVISGTGADKYWRDDYHPRYVALVDQWKAKPVGALSAAELLTGIMALLEEGTRYYTSVQVVMPGATTSEATLTAFYNRFIKREGDPDIVTFMLGLDSLPINAEKALYDLGVWCREYETLAEALARTPAHQLADLYLNDGPLVGVDTALWEEWRARFAAYLDAYGHMVYDLDFVNAVPNDDPAPLLETLKFHMLGQTGNPYERQEQAIANREAAIQVVLDRLGDGLRGRLFKRMLRWAHRLAPMREDSLADLGLAWPLMRQMAFELGRRLVTVGALAKFDEIFWLEADELRELVAQLDQGETSIESFDDRVQYRKALNAAQKKVVPPAFLPRGGRIFGFDFEKWSPAKSEEEQTGSVLEGIGASAGQVTATARVLTGPEDFNQMQPGDVLVAGITTPAWTPLFSLASAIVTDVGGVLSHSSIVAREYGIPAVLGTGVATVRIQSGQQILVDGDAGTVTLLDEHGTPVDGGGDMQPWLPQSPAPAAESSGSRVPKKGLVALASGVLIGLVVWLRNRRKR